MGQRPGRGSLGRHSTPSTRPPDRDREAPDARAPRDCVEARRETRMEAAPGTTGTTAGASSLTEREQEILAFERQWWKYAGAKEQAIRELFDMSATRYYQVLNALIDRPDGTRPSTRCWSSGSAGCAPPASGRAPRGGSAPPSEPGACRRPESPPPRPGGSHRAAPASEAQVPHRRRRCCCRCSASWWSSARSVSRRGCC